jgi:uncharacterized protein YijF (DUF1287 family)
MKKLITFIVILILIAILIGLYIVQINRTDTVDILPKSIDKSAVSPSVEGINPHNDQVVKAPSEPLRPLSFFDHLSKAAIERTMHPVVYDPKYVKIAYPMGDVPDDRGVCTDVVIRAYRSLGMDLQQLVHEDMAKNFKQYPAKKIWGSKRTDTNIDHRRVYNLQAFFKRFGENLPITKDAKDYQPGDLVTWQITPKFPHIGIMVDVATADPDRYMVVHNIANGPQIDDILFAFPITGHYRYAENTPKKSPNSN